MKLTKAKAGRQAAAVQVVEIQSLDQLQAMVNQPVYCEFKLNGQVVRLACRAVTQDLDEQVRALRRQAQPPWREDRKDFDYTNPKYLKDKEANEKKARNLLVYAGCPAVAAKKPGLTNAEEINQFVRGLLSENILELISITVQGGGMELVERANFTSTPASES